MPRLQPPEGFCTAATAVARLGISQGLLSRYVEQGKIKRYGPKDRAHKFYKESEIDALLAAREAGFEVKREKHLSIFSLASAGDMAAIVEISRRIFNADGSEPIPAEARLAWLRKNPETFFVLRDLAGEIVGYASILPLSQLVINRFIHDEIQAEDIAGDDVLLFQPGQPLNLYIMAIGIDPKHPAAVKKEYGARLVNGLFSFLLELAQRGVEIASITARSHKPDGLHLLKKMGFPNLRPLTPGKHLFVVEPAKSGLHVLMKYTDLLEQWKSAHPIAEASTTKRHDQAEVYHSVARAGPRTPRSQIQRPPTVAPAGDLPEGLARRQSKTSPKPYQVAGASGDLPAGLEIATVFAGRHFPAMTSDQVTRLLQTQRENGSVPMVSGKYKVGRVYAGYALDERGRAAFYQVNHERPGFQACDDCPHMGSEG